MRIDLEGREYYFERAWTHLLSGYVIVSKVTRCAYWLAKDDKILFITIDKTEEIIKDTKTEKLIEYTKGE